MGKRIILFLLTNILVVVTISIVTSLLGLNRYITAQGLDYNALLGFCLVWGMAGAFISLMLSKVMAKWTMGLHIIDPRNASGTAAEVLQTVHALAKKAGLKTMPEVAIYDSPEVNAFATGPSRNNSLVAVSSGLLNNMNRSEVEGVLGHEVAHIANGDMVTMTLIQGVVNAFTMFLARVAAFFVAQILRSDDEEGAPSFWVQYILITVFDILFSILGSIVVAYFSRVREFRADAGGAKLAGRESMIGALQRLKMSQEQIAGSSPEMATLKISNKGSWLALFSTHPALEDRIAALQRAR